jgi:membrane fusion protein, multidrug efflux system
LVTNQPVFSEYLGQTRGSQEVEIRARVEGFLQTIHFSEGLFVKKGDLLYTIDPQTYEATLAQAKGQLARAEAALARARQDVARYEPLIKQNAVSRQEYDQAVALERAGTAEVESARAVVKEAELQLSYTRVMAPVDGRIGKSEVQPGNLVGRGQNTLLTTISVVNPIHVRFSVSEQEYLDWRRSHPDETEGHESTKELFQLILADGTHYPHRGSIVFADRNIDPATATLLIEAAFPNPNFLLRPGQYGRVLFPTRIVTNAVLVPQRAVQELQATYHVFVVGQGNKAELRPVQPGARVESLWIIDSGLKPGEIIVVDGLQKLRQGVPVAPTMVPIEQTKEPPTK